MKRIRRLFCICLLNIVLFTAVGHGICGEDTNRKDWPFDLKILTGITGGQWDVLGNSIAQVLTNSVVPTSCRLGAGISNIRKVNKGAGDVGFSISCFLRTRELKKNLDVELSIENTALLAALYPQVFYIIVRKDFAQKNGIVDLDTLLKKKTPLRFAILKKGTGSHYLFQVLLKYGYNMELSALKDHDWQVSFHTYSEIADKFVNNELDCFAYSAGAVVPLLLSMEKYVDIVVLPIPRPILEVLQAKLHTGMYTLKPGVYKSITKPVLTLSDSTCLIVRKDLPEDLVYEINWAIWKNKKYISEDVKMFELLTPETALKNHMTIHPGSMRFWNELQHK